MKKLYKGMSRVWKRNVKKTRKFMNRSGYRVRLASKRYKRKNF